MPAYPKPHLYKIGQLIHEQTIIKQYWEYSKSGKLKKMYECRCIHCKKVSPKEEKNLKRGNKCNHCRSIRHRSNFKYNINDEINGLIIINCWFGATETDSHRTKRYSCKCKKCGDIKPKDESTLIKGHGCKICNQKRGLSSQYKYAIGDIIGTLRILERWYGKTPTTKEKTSKKKTKQYDYECIRCTYKSTISEGNLKKGKGCPVCCPTPQVVVSNLNSIIAKPETHWMIPYFIGGKEEASLYTPQSAKKIFLKCPYCNEHTKIKHSISNLYRHRGISCICGDRISYPERFMRAVLEHLELEFIPSFRLDGVPDKKYDFYIPIQYRVNEPIIIEMHGRQHYDKGFEKIGGRSQLEEKENDKFKREIAKKQGYKNYIEVDSRFSNPEYIKGNIINSNLFKFIKKDSREIDWLYCARIAEKNLVFEVCDEWNSEMDSTKNLSEKFNLSMTTIRSYLKRGTILGWCLYDGKKEMVRNGQRHCLGEHPNAKPVTCYDELGNIIFYFTSVSEMTMAIDLATDVSLSSTTIAKISRENRNKTFDNFKFSKGYSFKYEEDLTDEELYVLDIFKKRSLEEWEKFNL